MADTKQIDRIESEPSRARRLADAIGANRTRVTLFAVLGFLVIAAFAGLESDKWMSTILQGLSVGALVFLVASGFQLIFGLMDVLNLAHGELFMLGAYVGWTVYTRFDTFIDILIPILVLGAPFVLLRLWRPLADRVRTLVRGSRVAAWSLFVLGGGLAVFSMSKFPLAIWDAENFAETPVNMSVQVDLGTLAPLEPGQFAWPMVLAVLGVLVGGIAMVVGLTAARAPDPDVRPVAPRQAAVAGSMLAAAVVLHLVKSPLNDWVFGLSTTWRFLMAVVVASLVGAALGTLIEVALIRPLYDRPIYTLMITLGVGFVMIEAAREIWGRPEFTMARPAAFNGTGEGCPAEGFGGFFSGCSTLVLFGSRFRVYNEGFIVLMGILVLVAVSLLLKRSRIGMTIRAGVQDPEMVEALGINVRRVFTQVFALGSGLAALGGVLAAPSIGLSTEMGALFLLTAIVALAIGGLTSFPGAAAGALLVGLLQQLIIRLGQSGINIPFVAEPFKPSPTLVPAASIILMVIVLLVLPGGLFGRSDR